MRFGLKRSVRGSHTRTASTPQASAVRSSAPRFPGFSTLSTTSTRGCSHFFPNLIRSSLGGIFTNQVVACTNEEALEWLHSNNINIFTAQLQDSQWYYNTNMAAPTAIVMGTESTGLTEFWRKASNAKIKIPMLGELDSLNVSVSAAVLCYEAVRQRCSK